MDKDRLDRIVRALGEVDTRRGLLRLGAALPLAGVLAGLLEESSEAGLHHRRRARNRRGHKKENRKGERKDQGKSNGKGTGNGACLPATADLQAAINAAPAGSTLTLCDGIFRTAVSINKNLTLAGAGTGDTILNDNDSSRAVLVIRQGATVTVQDLTVATSSGDGFWGINTSGNLRLTRVTVTGGGRPLYGGGIFNNGSLTLGNGASVTRNGSEYEGGGIYNNEGNVTLEQGSSVTNNVAVFGGGIYNYFGILLVEAGASITGNLAGGTEDGGGIYNEGGTVTLEGGSNVSGNDPNNCAGDPVTGTCS